MYVLGWRGKARQGWILDSQSMSSLLKPRQKMWGMGNQLCSETKHSLLRNRHREDIP